jgi:hypothetical protein
MADRIAAQGYVVLSHRASHWNQRMPMPANTMT